MTKHTLNAICLGLLSVVAAACGDAGLDEDLNFDEPVVDEFVEDEFVDDEIVDDEILDDRIAPFDNDSAADPAVDEFRSITNTREFENVAWVDNDTLTWDPAPGASQYHVYSGRVQDLTFTDSGSCADALDLDLSDLFFSAPDPPSILDDIDFYMVAPDDGVQEGEPGHGTCIERRVGLVCP